MNVATALKIDWLFVYIYYFCFNKCILARASTNKLEASTVTTNPADKMYTILVSTESVNKEIITITIGINHTNLPIVFMLINLDCILYMLTKDKSSAISYFDFFSNFAKQSINNQYFSLKRYVYNSVFWLSWLNYSVNLFNI